MGLDATVHAIKGNERIEVCYWRNHGQMNLCMHVFNHGKSPEDSFAYDNLEFVPLADGFKFGLPELKIIERVIPRFEYGEPEGRFPNNPEKDLEFIGEGERFIKEGYTLEYDSC